MPAKSKAQQRFMGMVHAVQKGDMENPSPEVAKVASDMDDTSAKDFASTKHKGLPNKVKKESITKLKEIIKGMVDEMNVTGNVQGYDSPGAFGKPENEKKKGKRQADLTGYSVVSEKKYPSFADPLEGFPTEYKELLKKLQRSNDLDERTKLINKMNVIRKNIKLKPLTNESINENRWIELKREDAPAYVKVNRGISNMNKQLAEIEKFMGWYGRLKQENGVSNDNFWKRTNKHIYSIKERLLKLEHQIRKIAQ